MWGWVLVCVGVGLVCVGGFGVCVGGFGVCGGGLVCVGLCLVCVGGQIILLFADLSTHTIWACDIGLTSSLLHTTAHRVEEVLL